MTRGMEEASDDSGLKDGHATETISDITPNCDAMTFSSKIRMNELILSQAQTQLRVLRSGTRTHSSEPAKKTKVVHEDVSIDSDNENELVIDTDGESSSDETKLAKESSAMEKPLAKKYALRQKTNIYGEQPLKKICAEETMAEKEQPIMNDEDDKTEEQGKRTRVYKLQKSLKIKKPVKTFLRIYKPDNQSTPHEENEPFNKSESHDTVVEKKECPICKTCFDDSHAFTVHIREHNTNKSTHVCQICSKQLSSVSSLDRHMYVHSGERPFACSICNLRFTTNGNMHRHMKTHEASHSDKIKVKCDRRGTKRFSDGKAKECRSPNITMSSQEGNNPEEGSQDATSDKKLPKCTVCGKGFLSSTVLRDHIQMHSSSPVECTFCNVTFTNSLDHLNHSCPPANGESAQSCSNHTRTGFHDLANVEFSSKNFELVAKKVCESESRNPSSEFFSWECRTCSKAFPSNVVLQKHELSHISAEMTCHICKCHFASQSNYKTHQLKHRLAEQVSCQLQETQGEETRNECKEDFFAIIGLCKKEVMNEEVPPRDKNAPKLRQFDSYRYFVNSTYDEPTEMSQDLADISTILSVTSKTPVSNLPASPVIASPASPLPGTAGGPPVSPVIEGSANPLFEATISAEDYSLTSKSLQYESHKKLKTGETFSKCTESFTTSSDLKAHARVHAKTNQVYLCKSCNYKTVDKSTLKRHLRIHNGEHPFKCTICGFVFTTKANCQRHVTKKHKVSKEEAADYTVYNPNMLESKDTEGLETNSNVTVCKYCGKDFKYNRVLRHHLRSLNNSCNYKPFSCTICKQGFSTKNNSIRHILKHHPECKGKAKKFCIANQRNNTVSQEHAENQSSDASECESINIEPINLVSFAAVEEQQMVCEQEYLGNERDKVIAAQSLVSLQETPLPPQEKPLDLTISALNLSMESKQNTELATSEYDVSTLSIHTEANHTFSCHSNLDETAVFTDSNTKSPEPSVCSASPIIQPLNLTMKDSPQPLCLVANQIIRDETSSSSQTMPIMCIPQVISSINGLVTQAASIPVGITPKLSCVTQPVPNSIDFSGSNKSKALQKIRRFTCDICQKQFTLKSNRERHIKKTHPGHAKPPRSRNYIPALSPVSVQKHSSSTLSDKTRDALRDAIIAKTNNGTPRSNKIEISSMISQVPTTFQMQQTSIKSSQLVLTDAKSCSATKADINDLASVSAVIHTANCQPFKDYLNQAIPQDAQNTVDPTKQNNAGERNCIPEGNCSEPCKTSKKTACDKDVKGICCTYCNRVFPWKSSLSRHLLTHTGAKPHKCLKCPVSFTTKSNRDRHLLRQHKDSTDVIELSIKPYKCELCAESCFSTKGKLKKHYNLKHPEKLTTFSAFQRSITNPEKDTLPSESSMESADKMHSTSQDDNSDQLKCHICGNVFQTQHQLMSHLEYAHPSHCQESEGKDATCKECSNTGLPCIIKTEPQDLVDKNKEDSHNHACGNLIQIPNAEMTRTPKSAICACPSTSATNCVGSHNRDCGNFAQFSHSLMTRTLGNTFCVRPSTSTTSFVENQIPHTDSMKETTPKVTNNIPKETPNSLMYLFAAAQQARSIDNLVQEDADVPNEAVVDCCATTVANDGNRLLSNLLDIKDTGFIDEMLDSAARVRVKQEVDS